MARQKKRSSKRQSRESTLEEAPIRTRSTGHHIHVHEIHGGSMVRHLRRPYIVALGYRPDP